MQTVVDRWRRGRSEAASRAELVAMARAGGAQVVAAAEADVMQRLTPAFRSGAVLVGSHAFLVLGNQLGVRWGESLARTEDVDIAKDRGIDVALAREGRRIDLQEALGAPLPRFSILNPKHPATVFRVRGTEIEVELLTPMVGREQERPVKLEAFGAAATPLRFLDYLIEETQPGVVLGGAGVLVNVPRPGRFAMHKLIVASRRPTRSAGATKAPKDLAQAEALLRVLLAELPGEITLAWKALSRRGPAWVSGAARSLANLDPEIVSELRRLGIDARRSRRRGGA
jgi:hypothetical protein